MINIEIQGIREVIDKLKVLAKYTSEGITETLDKSTKDIVYPKLKEKFDNEGKTQYSKRWEDWTEFTIDRRTNRLGYYGSTRFAGIDKILQWSGRLKESIVGGAESTKEISKTSEGTQMILGTEVEYAKALHEGIGWNLPKRHIYEPKDFKNELIDYIREQIKAIINL